MTARDESTAAPPLAASRVALLLVGLVAAAVIATALAGGDVFPILAAWVGDGALVLAWLLAAWGVGDAICRAIRLDASPGDHVLRHVTAIAIGLGVGSIATLGLGALGAMNGPVAWTLLAAGAIAAIVRLRTLKATALAYLGGGAGMAWVGLLTVPMLAIAGLAACVVPGFLWGDEPAGYDVVAYHLQLPREWYELGRIATLPHNVFSFFPLNVEMHALLAMHLRGGAYAGMYVAQMMCGTFALLAALAVYGATRRRGRANAATSAVVMLAFPWVGMLMGIAYNEGGLMLFATLAAAWALRGRWLLAGACAGLAAGCKYTGATSAILLVPVVVGATTFRGTGYQPVTDAKRPRKHVLVAHATNIAAFLLAALVTFSPWLIRNAIAARNPVFPLALRTLGHGEFDAGQVERFEVAHAPRLDQQSLRGRLAALRDQVNNDWRWGGIRVWTTDDGRILAVPALLLLAIVPAIVGRPRDRETWIWLGLIGGNAIVWLFATHLQGRFLTQAIPCCAMLAGVPLQRWRSGIVAAIAFGIGLIAYREAVTRVSNPAFHNAYGVTDLRGIWDDDIRRVIDDGNAPIYLVGDERPFFMPVPTARLHYRSVFDVPSGVGFRDAWLGKGVPDDAWAIVTPSELERFAKTYRNLPPMPEKWRGVSDAIVLRARDVPNE